MARAVAVVAAVTVAVEKTTTLRTRLSGLETIFPAYRSVEIWAVARVLRQATTIRTMPVSLDFSAKGDRLVVAATTIE